MRIFAAFLRRDWYVTRSYRLAFVLDFAGTLLNLMLFFTLGRLVDRTGGRSLDPTLAHGFFSFALIGMVVFTLNMSGLTAFSVQISSEMSLGSLEALLATPARPSLLILASATYAFIRAVITAAVQVIVAALFFGFTIETGPAALAASLLALVANLLLFVAVGVVLAGATIVVKRTGSVTGLLGTAISLVSGIYYPVSLLPHPLDTLARLFPASWGIEVMRWGLLANQAKWGKLGLLALTAAIALPLSLKFFDLALVRARRDGSLGKY